ncbi:MAG TPA: type II secretion system protein [Longimicrobiales bacterium]|nr:type II secretion system protein [Longimicrobiales bacterium]
MRVLPRREGFTLIEILMAMLIVSILAAIAISLFWRTKDRGIQTTLQADLKTLAVHQEQYVGAHREYAAAVADMPEFNRSPGVVVNITYAAADGWAATSSHPSIPGTQCGLLVGSAPAASAPPATQQGIVMCTGQ